jgi:hypothetical protein
MTLAISKRRDRRITMDGPRLTRGLRIAMSAVCGILCVLLIVLWVRSCWRFDQIIHKTSATDYYVAVTSARGQAAFGGANEPLLSTIYKRDWIHLGFAMKGVDNKSGSPIPVFAVDLPNSAILLWPHFKSPFLFGQSTSFELGVPYWLLVVTAAAFGASPWLLLRFSLRALLIVTTLIALMLGLLIWASS